MPDKQNERERERERERESGRSIGDEVVAWMITSGNRTILMPLSYLVNCATKRQRNRERERERGGVEKIVKRCNNA